MSCRRYIVCRKCWGYLQQEIMTEPSSDHVTPAQVQQHAHDFFLARQPILNREQELIGYELLFRSAAFGPANVNDDVSATASVHAHASELGLNGGSSSLHALIGVEATVLMSYFINCRPSDKGVLELLEPVN